MKNILKILKELKESLKIEKNEDVVKKAKFII